MTEATPVRDWPKFDLAEAMNDLTLGEMEEWEDLTSLVFTVVVGSGLPAKGISALMYLMARRVMPEITWDDARARTINDLGGATVTEVQDDSVDPS